MLPAVFLLGLTGLAFEVALTRVFSVMLTYHFVFAIVSAAMLGLGLGGLLFKRFGGDAPESAVFLGALVFSLSLVGSVVLILTLPIAGSQELAGARFWVYLILAVAPFCAAGLALSGLFQRFPGRSSYLYGADLIGAAAGALAIVPAMDRLGAVNVIFVLAALAALAAVLLGFPRRAHCFAALGVAVLFGAFTAGLIVSGRTLQVPIVNDPNKEMAVIMANPSIGAWVIESRWSSFGRTDLVGSPAFPESMLIFVDGAAGSPMYDFNKIVADPQNRKIFESQTEAYFPLSYLPPEQKRSALILGPGGGRDVVAALLAGVKDITAVEVNPDVVKIVRNYADFSGGIYSGRPGVKTVVAEGRNYVRTSRQNFDVIMAAIPVTKSSRSVEGYALTENGLFTTEALEDYLKHLNESGRLVIVSHSRAEIYKLVATTLEAFGRQGVSEPEAMKHLYVVGSEMMPALVVQKQPLTIAEANVVSRKLHELGYDKQAFFVPWIEQQTGPMGAPPLDGPLFSISRGSLSVSKLVAESALDLAPPTDDRPFFYKFERGLPSPFRTFAVLLAASVAGLAILLLLPTRRTAAPTKFIPALRAFPRIKVHLGLFYALGIGYMLVEIALFQKLTLYLGQPQRALTVLLFSLLVGSGIGSLLTSLPWFHKRTTGPAAALGVAVVIVSLTFLLQKVFATGIDPRLAAVLVTLPLGILMGCPFPIAVRRLAADGFEAQVSVMWGVNGVASVLGSAQAMMLGITWGFSSALFAGAAVYVGVGVLLAVLAVPELAAQPQKSARPVRSVHKEGRHSVPARKGSRRGRTTGETHPQTDG